MADNLLDMSNAVSTEELRKLLKLQVQKLMSNPELAGKLPPLMVWGAPGIGKSSMLRFLYTLLNEDFVSYDEVTKKYSLGIEVYRLGLLKFNSLDVRKIARRYLQKLSNQLNMICYVGIREGDLLAMVDQILPSSVPAWTQLTVQSGGTSELYSTGIGRLFLAQDSDAAVERYLDRIQLKKFTDATITDRQALMELIRQARTDQFSGNIGENEPHIYSLCAPVYGASGKMVAGVSLCGLQDVVCSDQYDSYLEQICQAAAQISREMGYTPL